MSKFTNINDDKVVLIGSSKYKFLTAENLRVASDVGNVAFQYNRLTATSGANIQQGNMVFKSSMGQGMSTSVPRLECTMPVTFTDTVDEDKTWQEFANEVAGKVGLQCYPYARAISSGTVKFNSGQGITSRPSQNYQTLVNSLDAYKLALATDAPGIDQYSEYEVSSINIPIAVGANVDQMYKCRGFGSNFTVKFSGGVNGLTPAAPVAGVYAQVVMTFIWSDAIPLTPFGYRDVANSQPFYNLDDLEINMDLQNIFTNCFACNGDYDSATQQYTIGTAIAEMTPANIANIQHNMIYQLWKPSFKLEVPKNLAYASTQVDLAFGGKSVDVPAGSTQQFSNDVTLRLSQVPKMFAIMVNRPVVVGKPLRRLPITKISIDTAGSNDLLNNATQDDLYNISSKNGSLLRHASFVAAASGTPAPINDDSSIGCGSILYIKPSDMGLQDTIIGGSNQLFNFKCNVTVQSVQTVTEQCNLQVFAFYDAVTVADEATGYKEYRVSIGAMGALDAKVVNLVDNSSKMQNVVGGNFWGDIWSGIKNVAQSPVFKAISNFGRNNIPILKDFAGDGTTLGNVANHFGYGAPKGRAKAKPRKAKGGDIYRMGGKDFSEAQMDAMLDL